MDTPQRTYLIFWDVHSKPETLEELVKVKADVRVCLGNLISTHFYDDEDTRSLVYCFSLAQYYDCHVLKGENELKLIDYKSFAHPIIQEKFKRLPTKLIREDLFFLSRLPIVQSENDANEIQEKFKKLRKHTINALLGTELRDCYGQFIARNIDFLQSDSPKAEAFFVGREECAVWQKGIGPATAKPVCDVVGEGSGNFELDMEKASGYIVSTGSAENGCYCTFTLPEKKLVLYSV